MMKNKKILLGVTGSIAAYKSASLIRFLQKLGAEIFVVMTKNATNFITPLTMQSLSKNIVRVDTFNDIAEENISHIQLARDMDFILIAPATANFIAKLAHGIADDLLSTIALATKKPIFVAPAMNSVMWHNKITQQNIQKLTDNNINVINPGDGYQACGENGEGRFPESEHIIKHINHYFSKKNYIDFNGANIVVTLGGTREDIDPVRFIGNKSSGKMGLAIARTLKLYNANVYVVAGNVDVKIDDDLQTTYVKSTQDMLDAVLQKIPCDIFISTAAVSDWTAVKSEHKLKKGIEDNLTIHLTKTTDILLTLKDKIPFVVGFAAETNNLLENASIKIKNKNLDLIVANEISANNAAFGVDDNHVYILNKSEILSEIKGQKSSISYDIVEQIYLSWVKKIQTLF